MKMQPFTPLINESVFNRRYQNQPITPLIHKDALLGVQFCVKVSQKKTWKIRASEPIKFYPSPLSKLLNTIYSFANDTVNKLTIPKRKKLYKKRHLYNLLIRKLSPSFTFTSHAQNMLTT